MKLKLTALFIGLLVIIFALLPWLFVQVAETAAKVAKDKYNLNVEFVLFNDYALPNTAVSKGDLDANAMQHKPYLDEDVKAKNLNNLVIVGNTFVYPLAGYSKTIKNVNDLKEGAKIVVPNDPSNRGRALILLEKQGLIIFTIKILLEFFC